jgi:hypothetical protein
MGQAKRRGNYEVRLTEAKRLQQIEAEKRRKERLEAEKRMTPQEKRKRLEKAQAMAMLFGAGQVEYLTRILGD